MKNNFTLKIILATSLLVVTACISVGKGVNTLVPESVGSGSSYGLYFPDLVEVSDGPPDLRPLTADAPTDRHAFNSHLSQKYGRTTVAPMDIDVLVRNRTATPPLLPIDVALDKELLSMFLNKDIPAAKKLSLAALAKARLYNVPDLPIRTTIADRANLVGAPIRYNFFPRTKLELSAKLNSPSMLDRIAYIGVALGVKETNTASQSELNQLRRAREAAKSVRDGHACHPDMDRGICDDTQLKKYKEAISGYLIKNWRAEHYAEKLQQCSAFPRQFAIIDFQPKAADIVEFARGELTQLAQFNAKANLSNQDFSKATDATVSGGAEFDNASNGSETNRTQTFSPEAGFTFSDTFVNALKDSVEARTAGILENGTTFFADFRSIANKRIGGTYDYDLMFEVQSYVHQNISYPCVDLAADAYLIGIVRHVYKRGMTGNFNKVPEPENDKVWSQVVVDPVLDIPIWSFNNIAVGTPVIASEKFTTKVLTNHKDAHFDLIVNEENNCDRSTSTRAPVPRIAVSGEGLSGSLKITADCDMKVTVEFSQINIIDEGVSHTYNAPPKTFKIPKNGKGTRTVRGNYKH